MTPVCSSSAGMTSEVRGTWFSTRAQIALAACACGGATTFLYAVDPNRHAVYPQCLLYHTTGLYCAGCGATRAIYALLHGRVLEALHDNALFITMLPLILYVAGSYALKAWRANAWPEVTVEPRQVTRTGVTIFLLLLAFMVLRNLPGPEFAWLKPLAG
jgi:hypothetical protein